WHVFGRPRPAENRCCGELSLLDCIVDALQSAASSVVDERAPRAVADGKDRGVARARIAIDHDAVVAFDAARACEIVARLDPDADHCDVRRDPRAVREHGSFETFASLERREACTAAHVDAACAVLTFEKSGDGGSGYAGEHA